MSKLKIILPILIILSLAIAGLRYWQEKNLSEEQKEIRAKRDLIKISSPDLGEEITSPLVIKGEARGGWFFEASFLVHLFDENGEEWMIGLAEATRDWQSKSFVPFEATIDWKNPAANITGEKKDPAVLFGKKGKLVFSKANPSGLPTLDDQLTIPIVFGK